jgi:hypothetical protein
MRRLDVVTVSQISNGPSQLQNAVIGSGADVELPHCRAEQAPARIAQTAVVAHLSRPHVGVGQQAAAALVESLALPFLGRFPISRPICPICDLAQ